MRKDHYRTLGVSRDASEAEIELAYLDTAGRRTPEIEDAHRTLSDPSARTRYDQGMDQPAGERGPLPGPLGRWGKGILQKEPMAGLTLGAVILGALITGAVIIGVSLTGSTAGQLRSTGNRALEQGDLHTALMKHEKASAIRPGHPGYLADLARTYHALERYPEAITRYNDALEMDPEHPESLLGMAKTLEAAGSGEAAQEYAGRARRLGLGTGRK